MLCCLRIGPPSAYNPDGAGMGFMDGQALMRGPAGEEEEEEEACIFALILVCVCVGGGGWSRNLKCCPLTVNLSDRTLARRG